MQIEDKAGLDEAYQTPGSRRSSGSTRLWIFIAILIAIGVIAAAYYYIFLHPKCKKPAKSGWMACYCPNENMILSTDKTSCICSKGYQMQGDGDACVKSSPSSCSKSSDCPTGTSCQKGVCTACGDKKSGPCCSGGSCVAPLVCTSTNICTDTCGLDSFPCCFGNDGNGYCHPGNICYEGDCIFDPCHEDSDCTNVVGKGVPAVCGDDGYCVPCGNSGQRCCNNSTCTTGADLVCSDGFCQKK